MFGDPRALLCFFYATPVAHPFATNHLNGDQGMREGLQLHPILVPTQSQLLGLHLELPSESTRGKMANHARRESQEGHPASSYKSYKQVSRRSPNLFISLIPRLLTCSSLLLGVEQAAYIL